MTPAQSTLSSPGTAPSSCLTHPQCPTCAKCFLSRTELQLHEAFKHRGEKLFVCEECGHRASSRNGLQMHIKAKHRYESLLQSVALPAAASALKGMKAF